MDNIEALSERLGPLQIMNETSSEMNEQVDKEMSIEITPAITDDNVQAVTPKSMVPDSEQFDSDQTKFEDWQRETQLFLKSNKVLETDNRITAILACLRRDIVGIYAQKKLDELDKELGTQD